MSATRGPVAGPVVIVLAGVVIAAIPVELAGVLGIFGADAAPTVGFGIGLGLAATGVAAHLRPAFTTELGVVAIALSLLSVFGAFAGLGLGLLLGVIGGSLCVAWRPTSGTDDEAVA